MNKSFFKKFFMLLFMVCFSVLAATDASAEGIVVDKIDSFLNSSAGFSIISAFAVIAAVCCGYLVWQFIICARGKNEKKTGK